MAGDEPGVGYEGPQLATVPFECWTSLPICSMAVRNVSVTTARAIKMENDRYMVNVTVSATVAIIPKLTEATISSVSVKPPGLRLIREAILTDEHADCG